MKWQFHNVGKANAAIDRVKDELGIDRNGEKFLHINKANSELSRLQGLLAQKRAGQGAPVEAPALSIPVAPITAAAAPVLPKLSPSQCRAVFTDVFREGVVLGLNDGELLEDTLTRIEAARLTLPGGVKANCSGLGTREKMFRSQRQDRLDHVLKTIK